MTGLHVTVDTILKEIRDSQIDFYGGRTTLYRLLKKMEFSWTTVDGRKALIENENIVLKRIDFLRKYQEGKENGANFIFVDETWIFQKGTNFIVLQKIMCPIIEVCIVYILMYFQELLRRPGMTTL